MFAHGFYTHTLLHVPGYPAFAVDFDLHTRSHTLHWTFTHTLHTYPVVPTFVPRERSWRFLPATSPHSPPTLVTVARHATLIHSSGFGRCRVGFPTTRDLVPPTPGSSPPLRTGPGYHTRSHFWRHAIPTTAARTRACRTVCRTARAFSIRTSRAYSHHLPVPAAPHRATLLRVPPAIPPTARYSLPYYHVADVGDLQTPFGRRWRHARTSLPTISIAGGRATPLVPAFVSIKAGAGDFGDFPSAPYHCPIRADLTTTLFLHHNINT